MKNALSDVCHKSIVLVVSCLVTKLCLTLLPRRGFPDNPLRSRKQVRALSRQLWSMAASSFANPGIRDMKSKFPEEQSQLSAGRLPGQGFLLVSKASVAFPNP